MVGLAETGIRWSTARIDGISSTTEADVKAVASSGFERMGWSPDTIDPQRQVCLLFVDGLRGAEENVSAWLADALEGVPLAGGSAGDDLAARAHHVEEQPEIDVPAVESLRAALDAYLEKNQAVLGIGAGSSTRQYTVDQAQI